MFTDASAGVPSGTERGLRRTCEYCAMNCTPPIFGSRKNVRVTPAVASTIRSFAAIEPSPHRQHVRARPFVHER
jgi:hypothetical protein